MWAINPVSSHVPQTNDLDVQSMVPREWSQRYLRSKKTTCKNRHVATAPGEGFLCHSTHLLTGPLRQLAGRQDPTGHRLLNGVPPQMVGTSAAGSQPRHSHHEASDARPPRSSSIQCGQHLALSSALSA